MVSTQGIAYTSTDFRDERRMNKKRKEQNKINFNAHAFILSLESPQTNKTGLKH